MVRRVATRGTARDTVALAVTVVSFAGLFCACSRSGAEGAQGASVPQYPAELSADSSPADVAAVLIRALEQKDSAALAGLVAVKAESEAVESIYRRHGREANTDCNKVAAMTAGGWGASYAFVRNGSTEIVNESVDGDRAVVQATGTLQGGDACKLRIKFVREEGVWKVRAGIETEKP